jgi:hypothetical protein
MNPEFRRNLWLELTLHRLVAMPAVLVLVLALVYAATDDGSTSVATAAALIAAGLLGIWGARCAADSVMDEVRERTWDAQRMSAIGPWAMAWGKLLGAASFAWYGGLLALGALLVAAPRGWAQSPGRMAALIATAGLLVQAAACLGGLAAARKGYARKSAVAGWGLLVLLLLLGPMAGIFAEPGHEVAWWRGRYDLVDFLLGSSIVLAAWAVFGVYRTLSTELQVRTTPWAFAAFTLFLGIYLAGFWVHAGASVAAGQNAFLVAGLLVAIALTYVQLFTEDTGVIVVRRVQVRLARREWRRALEELPCWPVGLALSALFAALCIPLLEVPADAPELLHALARAPLALFLLLVRDAAIFLGFAFSRQPRRVEAAALFYLVLLYGILPGLLAVAGFDTLAHFVLPPVLAFPGKAAFIAAVHALLACGFMAWRWNACRREPRA